MYFQSLDIIRILGFLWIFLHHIQVPVLFIKQNGWIGMDLLFTLSGFLITSNFLNRKVELKSFYIKRALRIWPLYFLYLLLIAHYSEIWPYFLFVGNWRVMFYGWSSYVLVGHLWAISMQEQFYLLYPIFIKYFKNLTGVLVLGILFSALLKFYFFDPNNYYSIYMNTFTRLEPFLLGGLVAIYKDKIPRPSSWFIFILGLISFNLVNIRESSNIWIVVFGYLFVAIWCASVLSISLGIRHSTLGIKKLASLGFGLYVWHKIGIELSGGNVFVALIITLSLAVISYYVIEKRFLDLKKLFILFILLNFYTPVQAFDPLAVPNNRFGVHILDTPEIHEASKLVNSNGGEWGYVTIPMRSNDRDRAKWVKFFLAARTEKIIPIIRLATYPEGARWVAPTAFDLVDFANFLSEMPWPTKNRYLILFNEPNHANEWGGEVSPKGYVNILLDANRIFKDRSQDYFLLTAGLDMSAPNSETSMDALEFYKRMFVSQPKWPDAIDGLAVHAYPNPGFMAGPDSAGRYGITSFEFEQKIINKPIFITETGTKWVSSFWPRAFARWSKSNIVAITPFVLMAGTGDYEKFSILDRTGQAKLGYREIEALPKISGSPLLANISIVDSSETQSFSSKTFTSNENFWQRLKSFLKFERSKVKNKLKIKEKVIEIEIADTPKLRERGLSGRENLSIDTGMLFIFDKSDRYAFWMNDMKFNLDFIWLKDKRVVYLSQNIPNPATLFPPVPVDMVLEVNAGFVLENSIALGDTIEVW